MSSDLDSMQGIPNLAIQPVHTEQPAPVSKAEVPLPIQIDAPLETVGPTVTVNSATVDATTQPPLLSPSPSDATKPSLVSRTPPPPAAATEPPLEAGEMKIEDTRREAVGARSQLRREKLALLLPGDKPPKEVQLCLKEDWGGYATPTHQERIKDTIPWLIDCLKSAYLDRQIKNESRKLLLIHGYTANLAFASSFEPLKDGLSEHLEVLGNELARHYTENDLGVKLSDERLQQITRRHPCIEDVEGKVLQTHVLPGCASNFFDFSNAHPEQMHEHCYLHVMLMIAVAINSRFQDKVQKIATRFDLKAHEFQKTAPKAFSRAANKAISDYRYNEAPRCGGNIDTIRNLVVLKDADTLIEFYKALIEEFNGLSQLKNLFTASATEQSKRFHLVSLMATLVFESGITYGELCETEETKQAWNEYCESPDGEPLERWQRHTALARTFLESDEIAEMEVVCLGEVQMYIDKYAQIRHEMHEPYKVFRAEDQNQLHQDYLRTNPKTEYEGDADGLYNAAYRGQLTVAVRLLDEGHDIDEVGNQTGGRTPLNAASERGHTDLVHFLLTSRADIHKPDDSGRSPLYWASQNGRMDVVRILIRNGANVNQLDHDSSLSPLYRSCQFGHADVARVLVEEGADVNQAETKNGTTPVYIAAYNGHLDILKMLVDANANLNQAETSLGANPLLVASMNNHMATVQLCLELGANINQANFDQSSPLYIACQNGHTEIVKFLLDAGADIHQKNSYNYSPLDIASNERHEVVVALLESRGAPPNIFSAAMNGQIDVTCRLLDDDADINEERNKAGTPLYNAAQFGHGETVSLLIDRKADVNQEETTNGTTPIYIASYNGHLDVVRLLAQKNADINKRETLLGAFSSACNMRCQHTMALPLSCSAGLCCMCACLFLMHVRRSRSFLLRLNGFVRTQTINRIHMN